MVLLDKNPSSKQTHNYFFTLKTWASLPRSPAGHLLSGPEFLLSLFLHTPLWAPSGILYSSVPWPMEPASKEFPKLKARKEGSERSGHASTSSLLFAGFHTLHLLGWSAGPQGPSQRTRQIRITVTLYPLEQGGTEAILLWVQTNSLG